MAGRGSNYGQDITLTPGARCLTNASLHLWVCGGSGTSSNAPDVPNTTTMTHFPVGVIQTPNMSAGSDSMRIRPAGISAVLAGASCIAFEYLKVSSLASLTGYVLPCTTSVSDSTIATNTLAGMTAAAGMTGVVGQALENASTLQKFEMLIRPFVAGLALS